MPQSVRVVINEVAWAGTAANAADEWVELYNAGAGVIDLGGWALYEGETKIISLSGTISPGAYYLIERTDDTTVSDIPADKVGTFGGSGLRNPDSSPATPNGEVLRLVAADGTVADELSCSAGWFAGDLATKASMERIDHLGASSDPSNWASNDGSVMVGADAAGGRIFGTPAHVNSVAASAS